MVAVWHWIIVATSVNQGVKRVLKGWQICEICGLACHFWIHWIPKSQLFKAPNWSRSPTSMVSWWEAWWHGEEARRWLSMHGPASTHRLNRLSGASLKPNFMEIVQLLPQFDWRRFRWSSFSCDFPKYIKIHQNPWESLQCNGSFLAEEEHSTSRFEEAEVHQVHRSESHHQGGWRWFFGCMKDTMIRYVSICTTHARNGISVLVDVGISYDGRR